MKKKILIAHQSTIPHYRIIFYNILSLIKSDKWKFSVVFDKKTVRREKIFKEYIDEKSFKFSIESVNTYFIRLGLKSIIYQNILIRSFKYDLLIVEDAVNNLAYPLLGMLSIFGKKVAFWGHGRDLKTIGNQTLLKKFLEKYKLWLIKKSAGYFAYTNGVKDYLINKGIASEKIFVLNNTIDIIKERETYHQNFRYIENFRTVHNLKNRIVLLLVGRINPNKNIEFLLKAFEILYKKNSTYKLIIIGSGEKQYINSLLKDIDNNFCEYKGIITERNELSMYYLLADLFLLPGLVGLGPLQALCYNLNTITIKNKKHGPEYEYLIHNKNSIILNENTTPKEYAMAVDAYVNNSQKKEEMKSNSWGTIKHLTIENMAKNFEKGILNILDK